MVDGPSLKKNGVAGPLADCSLWKASTEVLLTMTVFSTYNGVSVEKYKYKVRVILYALKLDKEDYHSEHIQGTIRSKGKIQMYQIFTLLTKNLFWQIQDDSNRF